MLEWLAAALLLLSGGRAEVCRSTIFASLGDVHAGGRSPCFDPARRVRPGDYGIAHRTLRCGTRVAVCNPRNGRCAYAVVLDHGPYGALLPSGRWVVKKKRGQPGRWRGCADLTPALARRIGHDGLQRVVVLHGPAGPKLRGAR